VSLAKENGNWITLAVGDGANDVPMIMEAHIGVGIRGKEGTQAARSADYTIGKFKHLKNLAFVHGRLGYKRVAKFICYYFYKNVILVFCELYFAFVNGYSGQIFFADWLPMLYNAVFTSWPCIFTFVFERDVSYEYSLKSPSLYGAGIKGVYFNFKIFWRWMLLALFHGWVSYYFPLLGVSGPSSKQGHTFDTWWHSSLSFTIALHVVTYKLLLESSFWHYITLTMAGLSLFFYYLVLLILTVPSIASLIQPEITGLLF